MPAIFIANGAAVLMLVILIASSKRTIGYRQPDNQMFYIMVVSAILQCLVETATFVFDGIGTYALLIILNALSYINNIFFAFVWTMYADYKLFEDIRRIRRIYPYVGIPAAIVVLGSVVNMFTPVFFKITEENVYQRTELFSVPFLITYFYLAYGVVLIYRNKSRGKRYLFLPAILFMIPMVIGSVLQYIFYGLSLVWIGVAIALVSLYINVQNEVSFIDPLSGVFTRQYMNRYLETETHRPGQKKILAGIMLDIDNFKSINDRFGHLTGDDAIRSAGTILRFCSMSSGVAARYAGDEFVLILLIDDLSEIDETIRIIKERTENFNTINNKPYMLHFSMGYSIYDKHNDTVDSFIDRMDSAMYKDKIKRKLENTRV